uniref:P2X purinoreceptor 7 intracellular domain-containing protein n=1 Tax=Fundulus heteroclitus TaxID=8078 RepID=A0A3Q2QD41_FUNHE
MDSARECICCQEIGLVVKMEEAREEMDGEIPGCITDHPGMEAVCLNVWTLQVAWSQYKQQYRGKAFEGPTHSKYRHIPYRQFVRWCWDYLGKDTRVVIPLCAVSCVRAHFPTPGHEEDFTFRGHLPLKNAY